LKHVAIVWQCGGRELKIYISHTSDEALLGLLLKDFIESTFLGQVEAILSASSGNSTTDKKWLQGIDEAFGSAKVILLLCSPRSIQHGWIAFEAGCAWMKGTRVVSICHSGLSKSTIPSPLAVFDEVLDAGDRGFVEELFTSLAASAGIQRLPRLSYDTMMAELRATIASIAPKGTVKDDDAEEEEEEEKKKPEPRYRAARATEPEEKKPEPAKKPAPERKELGRLKPVTPFSAKEKERVPEKAAPKPSEQRPSAPPPVTTVIREKARKQEKPKEEVAVKSESLQTRILRLLAEAAPQGYTLEDLADILEVMALKLEPYLDALKEQAYVDVSISVNSPAEYSLASKGRSYLADSKVL
jgi:outer membrane biosynthesis protein TonB